MTNSRMTVQQLEARVFELEEIRIVVRGDRDEQVGSYNFERKAAKKSTVSEWLGARVLPLLSGQSVVVLNGSGVVPHGKTLMETVRNGYVR